MRTIFPPLMCPKIGLSLDGDDGKPDVFAAILRSRRHKSPEHSPDNVVAMCYEFTPEEREAIAAGENLYVGQISYGKPPNEQLVHIGTADAAKYYAVEPATPELLEEKRKEAVELLNRAWIKYQNAQESDDVRRHGHALQDLQQALKVVGAANQAAGF